MRKRERKPKALGKAAGMAAPESSGAEASAATGAAERGAGNGWKHSELRPLNDFTELAAELRELAERMLIEGATFEDVQEALNERGAPVTLQAVQNFFRGNLDVQKRRIEFQLERARILKEAFAFPESAEAQLANAAILTGLQRLSRRGADFSVKDSVRARLECENLTLKRSLAQLKIDRELEDRRLRKTKLHSELIKWQLARVKLQQLRRDLMREKKTKGLGPEALEKIQEIYGLLRIPVVARDPDPTPQPGSQGSQGQFVK
jgi:hypothetical protein